LYLVILLQIALIAVSFLDLRKRKSKLHDFVTFRVIWFQSIVSSFDFQKLIFKSNPKVSWFSIVLNSNFDKLLVVFSLQVLLKKKCWNSNQKTMENYFQTIEDLKSSNCLGKIKRNKTNSDFSNFYWCQFEVEECLDLTVQSTKIILNILYMYIKIIILYILNGNVVCNLLEVAVT